MLGKKNFNFLLTLIFIVGCAPKQSAINGDVFLTMGNGSIKPVAGAEIYLFPLEVDLDSSFVDPLKLYINNAKFNISKVEVESVCKEVNEIITNSLDQAQQWMVDGILPSGLELTCKTYSDKVLSLEDTIEASLKDADLKSESKTSELLEKQDELQKTKEDIYRLALNEGNVLKNAQMAKIAYSAYIPNKILVSDASKYQRYVDVKVKVKNNSDYVIKQVNFEKALKLGTKVIDKDYSKDPYLVELYKYINTDNGINSYNGLISGYSDWNITETNLAKTNSYSETIPGLAPGASFEKGLYSIKVILNFLTMNNRWLDENRKNIPVINVGCKKDYSWDPTCMPNHYVYVDLEFPDIKDIIFGEAVIKEIDPATKEVTHKSKTVDWVAKGRNTTKYKNSNLHSQLKNIQNQIEHLELDIKQITEEFDIDAVEIKRDENQTLADACNVAIDIRDTEKEVQECLANINNPDALVATINNSKTSFGYEIKEIFNSVTEDDLGYDNFEQILNAYGQSRNALRAITSIQGAYEFLEVPNGNYVLFTYYEDRFNGVGHWFEEITVIENKKIDLNNLNYKKEGVYSYLRDKIEE